MEKIKTPTTPSLTECDPQKNVLMKRNGIRGIIIAVVVTGVAFLIILISKWNEIRQQRIPFVWRNRLKSMISDCTNALKLAQDASSHGTSFKYAIEAHTILNGAKKLVGTTDLSKLSGYNISKIESEIEALLRRNIPNSLLLNEEDEENSESKKNVKDSIVKGPKKDLQKGNYKTLRDVAERYKLEYEDKK